MPDLLLQPMDIESPDNWRWVLSEAAGRFIADHRVALDSNDPKYSGLYDLPDYLWRRAAPDRRDVDEPRLVAEIGAWITEHVLGANIAAAMLARARPNIVVRITVPANAPHLMTLPLETAHVDGKPLSLRGVSLVFVLEVVPSSAEPVGDTLRMLAVFSLPPAESPLNLRRERQTLRNLVATLTERSHLSIELRVLQYGVTRASLQHVLEDGGGWDVVHFSGHGLPGFLALERDDGTTDLVSAGEIADMLIQAGARVKLVTLLACLSAAASVNQTLDWLGLQQAARRDVRPPMGTGTGQSAATVARALLERLDCAVLAMRYSVEDDFAVGLATALYAGLFDQKQPLPRAVERAVNALLSPSGAAVGALSAAAPALFGAKAATLSLIPPLRQHGPVIDPRDVKMEHFPPQPKHFVGRVAEMTRASADLAPDSGKSGVLLLGMSGSGKTSCATELAYHLRAAGRFQVFAWWEAPKQENDVSGALASLAVALEIQIDGLKLSHVVDHANVMTNYLPRLRQMLCHASALITLDNLETLLTPQGTWRDPLWGSVMGALLALNGHSRVMLTSRVLPVDLPDRIDVIPVSTLSRDEALLLVRDLPNLRALLNGKFPGLTTNLSRDLVRRALHLVQGHPKLIDLAEGLAADPTVLAQRLDAAEGAQDCGTGALNAFLTDGASQLEAAAFVAALRDWERGVVATLPEPMRLLFQVLCAVEDDDREGWIIGVVWPEIWTRLGRDGAAPDLSTALDLLVIAALIERQPARKDPGAFRLTVHSAVAEQGRSDAGEKLRAVTDQVLAEFWKAMLVQALGAHGRESKAAELIRRAGPAAFPYFSRLGEWASASHGLEKALQLDKSPAFLASVLPLWRRIVKATEGTQRSPIDRGLLSRVLRCLGRFHEAEQLQREAIAMSVANNDLSIASSASTDLFESLLAMGRAKEALKVADEKVEYLNKAAAGPWSQLSAQGMRLQALAEIHPAKDSLFEALKFREVMQSYPDQTAENDCFANPWNVRENILSTASACATAAERWGLALKLSCEILASQIARGATALEQARTRFNKYGPLLSLGRTDEALVLLNGCRRAFEIEHSVEMLGNVFLALAHCEHKRGHLAEAREFAQNALRYTYQIGDARTIANGHSFLASCLMQLNTDRRLALAHHFAAALIRTATNSGETPSSLAAQFGDFRGTERHLLARLLADFAGLCATVQQVEGVRFAELMLLLTGGQINLEDLLRRIIVAVEQGVVSFDLHRDS